ncbi:cupin domain-containing protein [Pseudomonas boanensis]|uniref:cupin domain-containing protein n=1 Tax=Metapseudomonas boanensis TaxID=2822138 RepID=UPI0035D45782
MSARFIRPIAAVLSTPGVSSSTPDPILLSGNGVTTAWSFFQADDESVLCGVWESAPFSKRKSHPDEMEFCYLIEGQVKISDLQGNSSVFNAGESFVVEPGFDGIWESTTRVRKYYVIAKCR